MSSAAEGTTPPKGDLYAHRDVWVDQLRTFMVILVVNMHACCTYSHVGSWYVTEGPEPSLASKIPFFFWQGHLQAFFMGLMFFLAGHFAHKSLARKSVGGFLAERFRRLMVPTFFYMLVLHPLIVVGINPYGIPSEKIVGWLKRYYGNFVFVGETGPLWFALTLFLFSVGLVVYRKAVPKSGGQGTVHRVTFYEVALFGAFLALGTFLVRLAFPIGSKFLNLQFCFFFQYVFVFVVGALSAKREWLQSLAESKLAGRVGWLGLFGGPLLLGLSLWKYPPVGDPPALVGGWNVPALLMATWEQTSGVALGVGCLALFQRRFDRSSALTTWLNENSFGVYFFHAPIMVALTGLLAGWHASPAAKTLGLTVTCLIATYLVSHLVRRVAWVRRFV